MRRGMKCNRLSQNSVTALVATLETVASRLIRGAHQCALGENRKKIVPRYLMKAIETDPDLRVLFGNIRVAGAGVMPTPRSVKRKNPPVTKKKAKKKAAPKKKQKMK